MSAKKWPLILVVAVLVLVVPVLAYFLWSGGDTALVPSQIESSSEENREAMFFLEATKETAVGVDRETSFKLRAPESVSKSTLESAISFEPEVPFTLKKSGLLGLIPAASAQEEPEAGVSEKMVTYEIKPDAKLAAGELYRVKIAQVDDGINREYSWAFQSVAPFQVTSTHPRNEGTGVPTNSTVEIFLNRAGAVNPADYIKIEPAVKGSFEVVGKKVIFKHGGLKDNTIYNVQIAKGLKAEAAETALTEDYSFSFETYGTTRSSSGGAPRMDFRKTYATYYPDQQITFDVSVGKSPQKIAERYELKVHNYKNGKDFVEGYVGSRDWNLGWTSYYRETVLDKLDLGALETVVTMQPEVIKADYQSYIELPDKLPAGYYIAELASKDDRSFIWFQVSPVSYYYSYTGKNGFMWVYDHDKQEPMEAVTVGVGNGDDGSKRISKTDVRGLAQFETPDLLVDEDDGEKDYTPKFFYFDSDAYPDLIAPVSKSYWASSFADRGDQYWDFISTDRYVYRPTDVINFWGVVKGRDDDVRQDKVEVVFKKGGYFYFDYASSKNVYAKEEAVVSSFDTIEGQLEFAGVEPGFYQINVLHNKKLVSTTEVEVLDFSKPAYQIKATPSADSVFVGDEIKIDLEATFFDGTPVPDLELKYSTGSEKGELPLDANGKAVFTYTAKSRGGEFNRYPRSRSFFFENKTAEEGEITTTTRVLVFEHDRHMQLLRDQQDDGSYELTAKLNKVVLANAVNDANGYYRQEFIGDPLGNVAVTAKITAIYYDKIENGFYYDPVNRTSRTKYKYNRREEALQSYNGVTAANGEWSFNFKPNENDPKFTSYRVELQTTDGFGKVMKTQGYVSNSKTPYFQNGLPMSLGLNSELSSNEFSVGDPVKLELQIDADKERAGEEILYYGYTDEIVDLEVTPATQISRSFRQEFVPGLAYQAVVVGPYGFEETNRVIASYQQEDSKLLIDIESDQERYKPGETVDLDLEVNDVNGKPAKAQVNLAAVDEALFHVLPYNFRVDMLNRLYSHNIVRPITGTSRSTSVAAAEGAEKGGCFLSGTPVLMADYSEKNIENINIGDQILTFVNDATPRHVVATVQGVQTYIVDEYMVINGKLSLTPEHRIFLNDEWQFAGQAKLGDYLTLSSGLKEEVTDIEYFNKPGTKVYNIVVGKYHTYIAHDYYVHNAEKGGSERSDFKDVALFESVPTTAGGKAEASFELPDNITSWRVTARAFDTDNIRAGDANKQIPVGLPLFAATSLNETYLVGDEPTVVLRAFGTGLKRGEAISYKVESESLGLELAKEDAATEVVFPLEALPAGRHEMKLMVQQGSLKDTLVQEIEVIESYIVSVQNDAKLLEDERTEIAGNPNGITELTFSDNGKGKYYPRLRNIFWRYGTRLDQLIAFTVAGQTLNEQFAEEHKAPAYNIGDYYTQANGLALFTYSDDDLELTAKAAAAIPDRLYTGKTVSYLENSLSDEKADLERISMALYGLASLEQPVIGQLKAVLADENLTLQDRIYLALGFEAVGDKETAASIYLNYVRPNLAFEGALASLRGEDDRALNSLALLLAAKANYDQDAYKILNNLSAYNYKGDLSRIDEVLAITELASRVKRQDASLEVMTDNQTYEIDLSSGYPETIRLTYASLQSARFKKVKGDILMTSTYDGFGIKANDDASLGITRQYFVNDRETTEFKAGDLVRVKLKVTDSDRAVTSDYLIKDYLPSGLNPVLRSYSRRYNTSDYCKYPSWGAQKLGNIVHFSRGSWLLSGSGKCEPGVLNYYARVVSPGVYNAEAPQVQSANDVSKIAVGEGTTVKISN